MQGHTSFTHGFTFAGHPVCAAIALANLDVMENEGIIENVRNNEGAFREMLDSLRDIPIVGDVRGTGYFHAIELVKDQDSDAQWTDEESETLLRGYLSGELFERGLICRADDRGDPVIQLSPPLIAGPGQFDEIESILRPVLTEAGERMRKARPRGCAGATGRRRRLDGTIPRPAHQMLTVRELLRGLDVRLVCRRGGDRRPRPLGAHLRAPGPDALAVGRGGPAHHRDGSSRRPSSSVSSSRGWPTISWPRSASGSASVTTRSRRRSSRRRPSASSRCSRSPTRCRSSRSPRPRSPSWSTSSTRSCAGRWPRTSGWSAWCSPSAGSTRSPGRWRP